MIEVYDFKIDNSYDLSLVPVKNILFSWKIKSDKNNCYQSSYRIILSNCGKPIYDSNIIFSAYSTNVLLDNLVLEEESEYQITLSIKATTGEECEYKTTFTTQPSNNFFDDAEWIKPKKYIDGWAPYIRIKFNQPNVKKAKLYACGLGIAKYFLNGEALEDFYLDPPMSNYDKFSFYRVFDITEKFNNGNNCFCALLGDGFYSQDRAWKTYGSVRFGKPSFICKIVLTLNDGTKKTIVSDSKQWKYKYSPITLNNVYGGEIYDARLETENFSLYDFADDEWQDVVVEKNDIKLKPCRIPPVRRIRKIEAKSITPCSGVKDGAWIIDFGEEIAGTVKLDLPSSPAGTTYVLRYAENLNGFNLDYRSTGAYANQMIQQDIYIAKGIENETYSPSLTYHGFRYVEITGIHDITEGYGTVPKKEMLTAYQISTDFKKTASFVSNNKYINKLVEIMENTYRSNFIGFPTDNPTRERCGWICDAHYSCRYGLAFFDTSLCYTKFLEDIKTSKDVYGFFTNIAPGKRTNNQAFPEFGCGITLISYYLYKYANNLQCIKTYFPVMEQWIEYLISVSKNYILEKGWGDWDNPSGNDCEKRMPKPHTATFTFYECAKVLTELSGVLKNGKEKQYSSLSEKIKGSVLKEFYDNKNKTYGYIGSDAMALYLGLYPQGDKDALLKSLLKGIKDNDYAIVSGMPSSNYLISALIDNGCGDTVMQYLFNEHRESYKFMLDEGATAIWEMISQGKAPDRDTYVLTYNQPMNGGFLYCVFSDIAGVKPIICGYSEFTFNPKRIKTVDEYDCYMETVNGKIAVSLKNGKYTLIVPPNTTALVCENGTTCSIDGKAYKGQTKLSSGKYEIVF